MILLRVILLVLLLQLSWDASTDIYFSSFRVYDRCSPLLDGGGTFTDYTETKATHLSEEAESNVYNYRCVTQLNVFGVESVPCPAIWIYYVRPKTL